MALPVIAHVRRVAINWLPQNGVTPRNVFHVRSDIEDEAAIAGFLDDAFQAGTGSDHMFHAMFGAYVARSITVTPLNGTSPGTDYSVADINADGSGDQAPALAAVVSFKTAQKGPRGRGRMFVGPIGEGAQGGGGLETAEITTMLAGWQDFIDSLTGNSIDFGVASYTHHDFNVVTSHRIDFLLGTMRRRQDQLR